MWYHNDMRIHNGRKQIPFRAVNHNDIAPYWWENIQAPSLKSLIKLHAQPASDLAPASTYYTNNNGEMITHVNGGWWRKVWSIGKGQVTRDSRVGTAVHRDGPSVSWGVR